MIRSQDATQQIASKLCTLDTNSMDIAGGTVNLLVSDEILAERRKSWVRPPLKQQKGVLNIYAQNCRPAEEGGAMQPWALDADYGYHHE